MSDCKPSLLPSWQSSKLSDILSRYPRVSLELLENRAPPALWDISSGCILWLPRKEQIAEETLKKFAGLSILPPEAFGCPVLVLDVKVYSPFNAFVTFALIEIYSREGIEDFNQRLLGGYIPFFPAPLYKTGNETSILRLENESKKRSLRSNLFINTRGAHHTIDFRDLRCYSRNQRQNGYRFRLTQESFRYAAERMGYQPSAWIPTQSLWEKFIYAWPTPTDNTYPNEKGLAITCSLPKHGYAPLLLTNLNK